MLATAGKLAVEGILATVDKQTSKSIRDASNSSRF